MQERTVIRAVYLAVTPRLVGPLCARIHEAGPATPDRRLVVEKPLGRDLHSARPVKTAIRDVFEGSQIFRIGHYLSNETVQHLMALRFANALFEPLWNSAHIDHVQITVAEAIGAGSRGGYYEKSGALRDIVHSPLLQLLCLVAMEPPDSFEPDAVRDEKLKVLEALTPIDESTASTVTVSVGATPEVVGDIGLQPNCDACLVTLPMAEMPGGEPARG